jgi:hypothetical protein
MRSMGPQLRLRLDDRQAQEDADDQAHTADDEGRHQAGLGRGQH